MEKDVAKLRKDLSLDMAGGRILETLRRLKTMPLADLEALSEAESLGLVDKQGLNERQLQELEAGLKKLDFYVCGILMHLILEEE